MLFNSAYFDFFASFFLMFFLLIICITASPVIPWIVQCHTMHCTLLHFWRVLYQRQHPYYPKINNKKQYIEDYIVVIIFKRNKQLHNTVCIWKTTSLLSKKKRKKRNSWKSVYQTLHHDYLWNMLTKNKQLYNLSAEGNFEMVWKQF